MMRIEMRGHCMDERQDHLDDQRSHCPDEQRQYRRSRLVAASLRLALAKTPRPHLNTVFNHDDLHNGASPAVAALEQSTTGNTGSGTWVGFVQRCFGHNIATRQRAGQRAVSQPTTAIIYSSAVSARTRDLKDQNIMEEHRERNVMANQEQQPRHRSMAQMRENTPANNERPGGSESSPRPTSRSHAVSLLSPPTVAYRPSSSATLVSVDMAPAIAQMFHMHHAPLTSPSIESPSTVPSAASPCVQISSSFLRRGQEEVEAGERGGVDGEIGPTENKSRAETEHETSRDGSERLNGHGLGSSTRVENNKGSDQPGQVRPPRSHHTGDTAVEQEDTLDRWLSRLGMGEPGSSPPRVFTPCRDIRAPSTSNGSGIHSPRSMRSARRPSTTWSPTVETYPRHRAEPGRVVYKSQTLPNSEAARRRPQPGEILIKTTPKEDSRRTSHDTTTAVDEENLEMNIPANEHFYQGVLKLLMHDSDKSIDPPSSDNIDTEKDRFASSIACLSRMYASTNGHAREKINEQLEVLIQSIEQEGGREEEGGKGLGLELSPQVSVVQGKHGDENYFGQTVLSPAFL